MKYKRGDMPGAFVLTARRDRQKFVMSEETLQKLVDKTSEGEVDFAFEVAWQLLTEAEKDLAAEIRRKYFT